MSDSFFIRVPSTPDARPVRDWLWSLKDPMASYFNPGAIAWQWSFPIKNMRSLWLFDSPRLES